LMTNYRGRFPKGMTMARGEGITGKVWASGKSMFVNDYFAWIGRLDALNDKRLSQSVAAVPVVHQGQVQGVISVGASTKDFFCAEDLKLLELLAAQAATALVNAQLHTQLKQHSAELERSNKELQDFAYIASHDLQEPLRKIQAFSDRLQRRYSNSLDERGIDYLVRLRDAASRMQNLIVDLLAFSRITTKAEPLYLVDLNKVVTYVLLDLEVRRLETNAEIHLDILPTLPADETQMRQLFQNLLSNALKFTIPGQHPIIHIGCETISDNGVPQKYIITVADNGIGFEEKYLDRIFGVFQRLHSRQEYDGTGVGLALCQKIVTRHQGTITAQSQLGKGTTFIITLPVPTQQKQDP
jgi:light-regulated signal transduction histidine kinase (bacteriophytochrome)